MKKETTKPTTERVTSAERYAYYRAQGFSQREANAKAIQDVIDWGVANGLLESTWASK